MSNINIPDNKLDIADWFFDVHNTAPSKIAVNLIESSFWKNLEERAKTIAENRGEEYQIVYDHLLKTAKSDRFVRYKMMAEAADRAFFATTELYEKTEAVQTHVVLFLKENGLFEYLEMESIYEFLETKKSPWSGEGQKPGNHYDIAFMIDYLLPTMEANGIPRDQILNITIHFSKARWALPYIKTQLADNFAKQREIKDQMARTKDPDELVSLEKALKDVHKVNPGLMKSLQALFDEMAVDGTEGMSRSQFVSHLKKIAKGHQQVDKALGYKYNIGRGGVITIACETIMQLDSIENMLSSLVDMHLGEPEDLLREVAELALRKENI